MLHAQTDTEIVQYFFPLEREQASSRFTGNAGAEWESKSQDFKKKKVENAQFGVWGMIANNLHWFFDSICFKWWSIQNGHWSLSQRENLQLRNPRQRKVSWKHSQAQDQRGITEKVSRSKFKTAYYEQEILSDQSDFYSNHLQSLLNSKFDLLPSHEMGIADF